MMKAMMTKKTKVLALQK